MDSVLNFAHRAVDEALAPGAWAVDATAGDGHDTCVLGYQFLNQKNDPLRLVVVEKTADD